MKRNTSTDTDQNLTHSETDPGDNASSWEHELPNIDELGRSTTGATWTTELQQTFELGKHSPDPIFGRIGKKPKSGEEYDPHFQ